MTAFLRTNLPVNVYKKWKKYKFSYTPYTEYNSPVKKIFKFDENRGLAHLVFFRRIYGARN